MESEPVKEDEKQEEIAPENYLAPPKESEMEEYEKYTRSGYEHIMLNFEKMGRRLSKKKTPEEKYAYLEEKFKSWGKQLGYKELDNEWLKVIIDECLELYDENTKKSSMTTQEFVFEVEERFEKYKNNF